MNLYIDYVNMREMVKGVRLLNTNLLKRFEKLFSEFYKLHKYTKKTIKSGVFLCVGFSIAASILMILNSLGNYRISNIENIAAMILKAGFTNLMIIIIGGILIDHIYHRN